ncbi:hypothetical protein HJC23_000636 [Cyclotella cryptica]|uniref:Chitinase n=1 Tax=Cyclotella cryptica TaxID=29204 RepID=A0ABD3Q6S6_9STRA
MGGMVSFDDKEAICDKTQYCLDHELNGFIIWELSGDLMRDFSTPLLDAVHSKLNDPSLSCKAFAYDDSIFPSQSISTDELPRAPNTMSSTSSPLRCPDGFSGSLPKDSCREFYTCTFGTPIYPAIKCPGE